MINNETGKETKILFIDIYQEQLHCRIAEFNKPKEVTIKDVYSKPVLSELMGKVVESGYDMNLCQEISHEYNSIHNEVLRSRCRTLRGGELPC
jgi:hypothetical protein